MQPWYRSSAMATALAVSILIVPFIVARLTASVWNPRRGFLLLLIVVGAFYVAYVLALMFLYLRLR